MNKSKLLKGIVSGQPLSFHMEYNQVYDQIPYIKEQFRLLEVEREKEDILQELSYDKFKRYWETGDRNTYQEVYYAKRKKLLMYSLLLWRNPENTLYKEELQNILWSICCEPMWALPAHFTDRVGNDLPIWKYDQQIDLFAAETGFALGEALRMCEPYLDKKCTEYVRLQLHKRIIEPFLDGNTFYRFEVMDNNWASVCGGAIGCVGILMLQDEEKLTNFLHRVLSCLEVYLQSFGEDGVCVEGVDYWTYGFGFFVCFADYLKQRTSDTIDLFKHEKVKQIACNQQAYYLVENHTISFADGRAEGRYRLGLSMYLKNCYKEVQLPSMTYAQDILEDPCYRFCLALRDVIWYDPDFIWQKEEKESLWLKEAQWFLSYGESLILVAKGGHNGESHNHNDCGSFILYKNGVPMLEDLGAGVYTAEYFSDKRYEIFVNGSKSHNVPLIEGMEQRVGKAYGAEATQVSFGDVETFKAQLKSCYPSANLESFIRTLKHDKGEKCIVLEDVFCFKEVGTVVECFISHSPITTKGTNAWIKNGEEVLTLSFGEGYTLEVIEENYENHRMKKCTAYILQASKIDKAQYIDCKILMK